MTSWPIWIKRLGWLFEPDIIAGCDSGVISESFGPGSDRGLAHRGVGSILEACAERIGRADHRHAKIPRRAGNVRFQQAAAARRRIAVDDRAHGTWHRANGEPALLRPVQSGRKFPPTMRGS